MNKAQSDRNSAASLDFARRVLDAEAEAIRRIPLGEDFDRALDLVLAAPGSLVVSGLGKSGLVGQKLSATFASTGTPSLFLHPAEAMHGDLGRVRRGDAVLLLSFGGNTEEVVSLAELLRQDDVPMIALVGQPGCDLGRLCTITLAIGDVTEACPLNLAPTASTTAMLALGDALALAVSRRRNFGVEDFRRLHPGGGLGRQLMPVLEAMRFQAGENLPLIPRDRTVEQAYAEAERHAQASGLRRPGALLIVGKDGSLAGIVTDGDLRTALIRQGPGVWQGPISKVMTARPTTLGDDAVVRDAVRIVREHRFDEIPVVDAEGRPVGLIDVQDLAALKVIEG
ncbi:MAG: KpsF/GutQ family sugar-phosphate isomerase [Phycisphaeraceae bacterium]